MSSIINTNIGTLNAQRNLSMSQNSLATAMQRLSSGLRINSAKDDAAGLAISERFSTQIRGLNQAMRNANDGISLSQTAEGALGTITNNLQRIRELAVQSANATNSASDRAALNREVEQRLAEIDRVATQTQFNGRNILDGSFGSAAFQIGANVGQTINIGLGEETSMRQTAIGQVATATSVDLSGLISPAQDAVDAVNATFTTGVISTFNFAATTGSATVLTSSATGTGDFSTDPAVAGSDTINFSASTIAAGNSVTLNGVTFTFADSTDPSEVVNGTSVTVNVDFTGGASQDDAVTALASAIGLAVTDAGDAGTGAALTGLSAGAAGTTLTVTDTAAGLAATVGRTLTTAIAGAVVTQDVTGADEDTSLNSSFTIALGDETFTVQLNTNITNATDLLAAITNSTGYGDAAFTAALDGDGNLVLTAKENSADTFTIGGDEDDLVTIGTNVAGEADGAASPLTFTVAFGDDTVEITLDDDYEDLAGLRGAIATQLTDAGVDISVANGATAGTLVFSATGDNANTTGNLTLSDTSFFAGTGTAVAGVTPQEAVAANTLTLAENALTITIGEGEVRAIAANTYETQDALLAAINNALGGEATASITDGVLSFSSREAITIGGAEAENVFSAASFEAGGSLASINVNSVAASNETILRVDSALSSVSELRSTFGAIQNRLESTIQNLMTTTENLTASRSRIMDADFAQETAALSRAQILQQAGVAMVAQANQMPQGVLALLR